MEKEMEKDTNKEITKDQQLLYLCYCYLKDRGLIDDFKDYIGVPEKETSVEAQQE